MKIVALGHYSRTGKDTFANELVKTCKEFGMKAKKISFAWKLKEITYDLYKWAGVMRPEFYETVEGAPLRDVPIAALASELFPDGPTVVDLWVSIGTPCFRESVYPSTWIDYVLKSDHDAHLIVIPDCRFWNEMKSIKEMGGTTIKVVRPGYTPRTTVADLNLLRCREWDAVIGASGNIFDIQSSARDLAHQLLHGVEPKFSKEQTRLGYAVESQAMADNPIDRQLLEKWAVLQE